ncbi:MAG: hypothetical protein FD181_2126 [Prolixibacteraceae bacterium]|nr:MAG: hypothetical protein FD181_2126 [Prolixibacteraceae bacterium]
MMFFKISLCLILTLFSNQLYSAIITVDNNYPKIGDYATLQEGHDAANNGDTLYVLPSLANYSAITLQKSLCIIGAGYHSQLPGIRPTLVEGTFEFTPSSSGSTLTGFGSNFYIIIDGDNIAIKRNKLERILVKTGHYGTVIIQNHLYSVNANYYSIDVEDENEAFIANNIVKNHSYDWTFSNKRNNGKGIKANQSTNTSVVIQNIIDLAGYTSSTGEEVAMDVGTSNTIAFNNIILLGPINGNQLGFYNNLISPDIDSVFENYLEDNYQLKANSPAKGTGYGGADMGIYGGEFPFVDGGTPSLPTIYYLDVPLSGTKQGGINVTIKVKSN